ncbi:hypothetical protein GOP47_0006363 [Adiantum capillus-veneris]|uniref:non-specific serine/threonine protein kinase n=1 Tax=Adiantum capillus-veneris TaxID=13818 RepID=A0A9D4V3J5_ADICA|nr:hypothetical protein GOP47_0006363 [Adiantum capillus-veneris]
MANNIIIPPTATAILLLVNCLLLLQCQVVISADYISSSGTIWNTSAAAIPSPELYALLELKARLANSAASRAWNESNLHSICNNVSSWRGVTCSYVSGQSHITAISLPAFGLAGSLPPHLGNFTFLSTLNLSSNLLTGGIPAELSRCSSLQLLDLGNNSLTGPIPLSLGSLPALQHLRLCFNNLSGGIPPALFTNSTSLLTLSLCANRLSGSIPPLLISSSQAGHHLPRLQNLFLWGNNLTGSIPRSLGNCTSLVDLELNTNQLSGHILDEIGFLGKLQTLLLRENRLVGAIPASLGMCKNLIQLSLSANQLTGGIPKELGNLTSLAGLWLYQNNLTGIIPRSLGNCTSLVDLELSTNQLSGHIPDEIGYLGKLQTLLLRENRLVGAIPASLGMCKNLIQLSLSANQLTGGIPKELGNLASLTGLWLYQNNLTGIIPRSLGNCTSLVYLELNKNQLSGHIPDEIGYLGKLQTLFLRENRLVGAIPASLGNCTSIVDAELESNELSGSIPRELGQLAHLQGLSLWQNNLNGIIPESLGNCTQLATLQLTYNQLNGFLPSKIINLKNLQILRLGGNHLSGFQATSPDLSLSNATTLIELSMFSNRICGRFPPELGQLRGLQLLELGDNKLSGDVPWDSLSNCTRLWELDLSHNQLAGHLSSKLGRLQKLYLNHNFLQGPIPDFMDLGSLLTLDLSFNHLNGTLPNNLQNVFENVVSLKVSHNYLSGNLPPWFGQLMMVETIDLSHNRFVGTIPENLVDSKSLKYLDVSGNNLRGEFPLHFNNKSELISLNLSSNELTGLLPSTLGLLQHLQFLNISFNNFEGPIPLSGVFKHLNASWFQGNPRLCGPIIQKLCNSHHRQAHLGLKIRILIALAISLVVLSAVLLPICYYRYLRKSHPSHEVDQTIKSLVEMRHFSTEGLWESTQGYSEQNLLGEGAIGVVYKGVLPNGEVVAVKRFKHDIACSREALLHEVHILSKLRHRNLVKVLGCVLNLEVNALVLQFMPNGSLEQYLSQANNHEEARRLSWEMILKVTQGVTNVLAYLHHEHDALPIIHGDVKPGNILLDSELEAHLADFGLAKLAKSNTRGVSLTSNFKGSIGYMAPEIAYATNITTKVDIYSFGIVILEMLTGMGPTHELLHGESLHEWVKHKLLLSHNRVDVERIILAPFLQTSSLGTTIIEHESQASLLLQMAVACTEERPNKRPSIPRIKSFLDSLMVS